MWCVNCREEVERKMGEYTMVAVDVPYINLFFHKKCLEDIEKKYNNNLSLYLTENYEIWYNIYEEYEKANKKRRKRGKTYSA